MSRPVVVLPHPDSPTRPREPPLASANETPSTACTLATVRRITPPDFTGKYFVRLRTSRSVSLPTEAPGFSGARSTSELVTVLILPSNLVRVDICDLGDHLTGLRVDEVRRDLRQHFLGVDLAGIGQVAALDVVLAAISRNEVGQSGPAQVTGHLVDVGAPRVEGTSLRWVEQARGISGDRDQPDVGIAGDLRDAPEESPGVGHLRVGED